MEQSKKFHCASRVIFFRPCERIERNGEKFRKKEKSCLIDRRKNYERIEAAITTEKITRRVVGGHLEILNFKIILKLVFKSNF